MSEQDAIECNSGINQNSKINSLMPKANYKMLLASYDVIYSLTQRLTLPAGFEPAVSELTAQRLSTWLWEL